MDADVIIITNGEAQRILAIEAGKVVRITPLKLEDGRWYLAPNVVERMGVERRYRHFQESTIKSRAPERVRLSNE